MAKVKNKCPKEKIRITGKKTTCKGILVEKGEIAGVLIHQCDKCKEIYVG